MTKGWQTVCIIVSCIVIFRGVLSLLPDAIARDIDGSLTGLGFWIPMVVSLGAVATAYNLIVPPERDDFQQPD